MLCVCLLAISPMMMISTAAVGGTDGTPFSIHAVVLSVKTTFDNKWNALRSACLLRRMLGRFCFQRRRFNNYEKPFESNFKKGGAVAHGSWLVNRPRENPLPYKNRLAILFDGLEFQKVMVVESVKVSEVFKASNSSGGCCGVSLPPEEQRQLKRLKEGARCRKKD